jgi:hypothetical protein
MNTQRQFHAISHYLVHDYAIYIYLFLWNSFWAFYLDNLLLLTGLLVLLHNLVAYPLTIYREQKFRPAWWSYFIEDAVLFSTAFLLFAYSYWLHFTSSDHQTNVDVSLLILFTWACLYGQKYWQQHAHKSDHHPIVEMQLQQPFFAILTTASGIVILEPILWIDKIIVCFFCFFLMLLAIQLGVENWQDFKKSDRA